MRAKFYRRVVLKPKDPFMIISTIRQELTGIINLAIPILGIAYFFPALVLNVWGIIFWACAVGAYLFYKNFQATIATKSSLLFAPTGAQRDLLFREAERCGIPAADVDFRYAYCDDAVALTMFPAFAYPGLPAWQAMAGKRLL